MTEVLEAELVFKLPRSNYMVGILLSTILISSIFLILSYSASDEDDAGADFRSRIRRLAVILYGRSNRYSINVYHDHFRTNETCPQWLLDDLKNEQSMFLNL